ncbi:glycoside hydrolase family 97 protein [Mucilaginibacter sp. Bleaf8]|uniref:glycoside hydrolase family 97 protein n=1 Tax=Mucilaginibacter sp. Bleaf8 TaxID=2834430 RepID=UPI001BCF4DC4|nr:glycoside hydrolase family 97 protein [Mucilaginibacter sp. Bleaf8]MBS7564091.1 glycoside hydrolase family 97 protein [Mucilaginibacter sp. Bleaf8]
MQFTRAILIGSLVLLSAAGFAQKKYVLTSPDKSIKVELSVADSIYYQLSQNGKPLAASSAISFKTDADSASGWKVTKTAQTKHQGNLSPVVWQKSKTVADNYSQLHLDFSNGVSLEWRAYNNGVAWHWINNSKKVYKVLDEQAALNFADGAKAWYPEEDGFYSHNERKYKNYAVSQITPQKLASLPVLFDVSGTKVLLTEAGLFNYAGMWVRGNGKGGLRAVFPHYPKEKKIEGDRDEKVVSRESFIAQVNGAQEFPWRILMVAKADQDILTNQLPYLLGRPSTGDYSWVKPGKVQWDWWHYNNIYGVDFKAGINNNTYKYYIDFASKYGIEYVLLDEGWCDTRDLMKQVKDINVEELSKYAQSKGVNLLLWTSWVVLDKQLDMALDTFARWGIKGIKVDFMQRDDQDMVNYYERVAQAAAKRKLLVDFHGAYKPTGWSRTYPNVMTSEGVMGNENTKFAAGIDPPHTATLPFIRMAAGPMDFTPGGMINVQKNDFAAVPSEPMTLGTRCNQMAMYVIYESPLQMLCDIPTHYYREPECMEFLKAVPTVWQQTVPLAGAVGQYVAMARQAPNNDWYIGSMTDWSARELNLDLSFLGDGNYTMQVWKDGANADKNAKDFKMETLEVNKNSKVKINMTTGGGYVAILHKK